MITELARYLSMNAIDHSISNREDLIKTADSFLERKFQKNYAHSRNILIVGAGISHNANTHIKLATEFANNTLKNNFELKLHNPLSDKSPLEKQLDYLVRVYNLKKEEFETIMLACSRFDNEEVLRELKNAYDIKHVPNLFFEIVGHMFKHRFIDIIINFNFDEILDNIIEDEMSGCEYHSIISDGDLSDDFTDLMLDHRLKKPIYIKPHGTISHPSTLRFNKAQYFALPSKISDLLKTLFIGNFKEKGASVAENLKLNLIIAGFGMQSNDLNYILNECLLKRSGKNANKEGHNPGCNFFVFDVIEETNTKGEGYLDKLQKTTLFDGMQNSFFKTNIPLNSFFHYCKINKDPKKIDTSDTSVQANPSLEDCFYQLFNEIEAQFKKPLDKKEKVLRGIERHLIISELFQHERTNQQAALKIFESKEKINDNSKYLAEYYLLARLYTELALLLVHSNGLLNIRQLKESRVNKYFKLLKRFYETPPLARTIYPNNCLEDFIKRFGMREYKYFAKDTFVYDKASKDDTEEGEKKYVTSIVNKLFSILQELNDKFKNKKGVVLAHLNNKKIITEYFHSFYSNYDWQIKPTFNEYSVSKFKSITDESFLHTDFRFTSYRRKFYLKNNWNINVSVTKGANWLVNENWLELFRKNASKKLLYLIQADFQEKTFKPYQELPSNEYNIFQPVLRSQPDIQTSLHWSLHNQHLHLFLKLEPAQQGDFITLKKQFLKLKKQLAKTSVTATQQQIKIHEDFIKINKKLDDLIEVKNGIYYQRRLLSKRANPIYFEIDNEDPEKKNELIQKDLVELLDLFVNYWARASCSSSHAIKDYSEFIEFKIELFESFFKNLSQK